MSINTRYDYDYDYAYGLTGLELSIDIARM